MHPCSLRSSYAWKRQLIHIPSGGAYVGLGIIIDTIFGLHPIGFSFAMGLITGGVLVKELAIDLKADKRWWPKSVLDFICWLLPGSAVLIWRAYVL